MRQAVVPLLRGRQTQNEAVGQLWLPYRYLLIQQIQQAGKSSRLTITNISNDISAHASVPLEWSRLDRETTHTLHPTLKSWIYKSDHQGGSEKKKKCMFQVCYCHPKKELFAKVYS